MKAVKTVVCTEADALRLRAERAEAERDDAAATFARELAHACRERDVAEARAAFWHAEYTVVTNSPRSRAAKEASLASDEAMAKLEALGAKPQ